MVMSKMLNYPLMKACSQDKSTSSNLTEKEKCFTLAARFMKEAGNSRTTTALGSLYTRILELSKVNGSRDCFPMDQPLKSYIVPLVVSTQDRSKMTNQTVKEKCFTPTVESTRELGNKVC